MKKKIIVVLLLIVICLVGCGKKNVSPFYNKEKLHDLYYDVLPDFREADKKSGTLESGMDWESYSYSVDNMIITITYYKGRNIDTEFDSLEEIKIDDMVYKYNQIELDNDHRQETYYTQVGTDSYVISAVYKNTTDNRKTFDSFMDTVKTK